MATAVSMKTPPIQAKMKRPPAPAAPSTITNGANASSSPSPSMPSKPLPSGSKQPANSTTTNGVDSAASKLSGRQRKESQKASESYTRKTKSGKENGAEGPALDGKDGSKSLGPEPYVKTTAQILRKFQGCPPSLIVHLHPTHFRFEQQDGSFGYNSPMKAILESIRAQIVPHDLLEELFASGVRFYDGCLIVQIHDHRTVSASSQVVSTSNSVEKAAPFSIHNYNEHLTPSPYVPYPTQGRDDKRKLDGSSGKADVKGSREEQDEQDKEKDKENQPAEEQAKEDQQDAPPKQARIFTTVLHSTPLSLQMEMAIYATTADPRVAGNRRQSHQTQPAGGSTPTLSSSMPPPTPSLGGPPTPTPSGPPAAKRQKMLLDPKNYLDFEAEVLRATASPLFLDPVNSFEESQLLLKALQDPLHKSKPPPPKTRKRTVAELAADEALAAEEERFMLIMDERLAPAASGAANGGKSSVVDGGVGSAAFEPRFSRFKTIENIKIALAETHKRDAEAKQKQELAKRQQQAQAAAELQERRKRELEERARMQQQLAQQQAQAQHSHPQIPNAHQQHIPRVPQGQHSSPVVRQQTPMASSPLAANAVVNHPGGVSMSVSSSNQGQGSPARPPSAAQIHQGMIAQQMSRHPSQHSSGNGTPQMAPASVMQQTPVMRHMTPTPRVSHASPVSGQAMANTPVMGQNMMMGNPQGMQLTPQQQHALFLRQQQAQLAQAQANQSQTQLSPQQILQLQQRQQAMNQQAMNMNMANPDMQQQQYNAALNRQMQQQLAQLQAQSQPTGMPNMHANQNPRPQMSPQQVQHLRTMQYQRMMANLSQQYNGQVPQHMMEQVRQRVAGMDPRQILQGQMMARMQMQQAAQQVAQNQNGQLMQPGQGMANMAMQQGQGRGM